MQTESIGISGAVSEQIARLTLEAGNIASAVEAATRRAQEEALRGERAAQERQRVQEALERRLDEIIDRAAQGLTAIVELGRTADIRRLLAARSVIGLKTPLFVFCNDWAEITVVFGEKSVVLTIEANVPSSVQSASVRSVTRFVTCRILKEFQYEKSIIRSGWFWHIFHADLACYWLDGEYGEDDIPIDRPRYPVKVHALAGFDTLGIRIGNKTTGIVGNKEVEPNWVLLRFLHDCCTADRLRRYLNFSLKRLC